MRLARCLLLGCLLMAGCRARGDFVTAYQVVGEQNARDQASDLNRTVFRERSLHPNLKEPSRIPEAAPITVSRLPWPPNEPGKAVPRDAPPDIQPVAHWQVQPLRDAVRLKPPIPLD